MTVIELIEKLTELDSSAEVLAIDADGCLWDIAGVERDGDGTVNIKLGEE